MSNDNPNEPTDLSPEGASEYQARLLAAQQGHVPVGGAPMPSIPRLDQPPSGTGDRFLGVQQSQAQQVQAQKSQPPEGQGQGQGMAHSMTAAQHAHAVAEGQVIPGVGSAYIANQPKGVQIGPPPQEGPAMEKTGSEGQAANPIRPEGGLSEDTIKGLEAISQANAEEEKGAEKKEKESEDSEWDDFDFEEFGRASRDLLTDKSRRKAIEDKITDKLDFEGLIINQELRQGVPIRKGFEPKFRTPGGHEDLFIKRLIGKVEGSERYILDYFALMGLVCGLFALNGKPLPSHLNTDGEPDEKLFEEKMQWILRYPIVIITDLSINFSWFTVRVQKLLDIDQVKDF